jgi:ribonuclease Y
VSGVGVGEVLLFALLLGLLVVAVVVGIVLHNRNLSARREHDLHVDLHDHRQDIERREQRLAAREERNESEARALDRRAEALTLAEDERKAELARIAGLTADEARAALVSSVEADARREAALLVRDIEQAARENAETEARRILTTVVQRLAGEQTAESTVSSVRLPSDDLKGRIIGRDGRNIRAFEQVTGVNLVIDDTPGSVQLSCFDPVRREVARLTLEALVEDGRIHPSRIEDVYRRCEGQVEEICLNAGRDACLEMGITDLHPELVATMGRLRYRTSYGQNVLRHLVESGHAAGLLADELGLDRAVCVRGAFLHDIGKALTHEMEGSHAIVGADLARRYGEPDDVVHAIEAHHNEIEPRTAEAVLTQAADAMSGGRPGARRESLEAYVERLTALEELAGAMPGVQKVFAMHAGREVRVMVHPEQVDDVEATLLARDIAKMFEEKLTYPGQIKVTVIRESRATEIAR